MNSTIAVGIHHAEIELRFGLALIGRETKPLDCFGVILCDTVTCAINAPESDLSLVQALLCGTV